jgi:hypothetical protein
MKTRIMALAFVLAGVLGAAVAPAADKPAKKPAAAKETPKEAAKVPAKEEPKLSAAEAEKQLDAAFPAFLKTPNEANFLKVHKLVVAHPDYSPYSSELDDAVDLLGEKKFKEVREKLAPAKYNLLLSPRTHQFLALAAKGLGDGDTAKRETEISDKCIAGIRATGDGSEKKPMLVTRVSDEYDVVRSLGKRVSGQGLRIKEGKYFDALQCADKSQLWFDITAPFGSMAKTFKPRPPKEKPAKQPLPKDGKDDLPPPAKEKPRKDK